MRQIEEETAFPNVVNGGSHHPMRDTREALEKLVARMDSLESDFDRLAEKSSMFQAPPDEDRITVLTLSSFIVHAISLLQATM
jgi:hypothetical protein